MFLGGAHACEIWLPIAPFYKQCMQRGPGYPRTVIFQYNYANCRSLIVLMMRFIKLLRMSEIASYKLKAAN